MNAFLVRNGVSKTHSPRTIVTGKQVDFNQHCRVEPGAYVHTCEEHNNTMRTQTVGEIALQPMGNSQGSFYFLSLTTGHRINRRNWTELPMPNKVIYCIHALARRNRSANGIAFGWRDGTPIIDDEDDNNDMADTDYNLDHYDSEDDNDYDSDSKDDGGDDAGANDPQPIAGVEHNNNNKINEEDDSDSEPNDEVSEDDVDNQPADNNESDDDNYEAPYVIDDGEEWRRGNFSCRGR